MKKLFLSSSFAEVAGIFAAFEKSLSGKTVTFIPTASKAEKVVFYVKAGRRALEKMGLVVEELDISTAHIAEAAAKIKNNDFIYVTGGNTFFLLQELKRTGADRLIVEAVNAGKTYVGESAGAMVAAPGIEYAKAMDSAQKAPALQDFTALGLVSFYTLPHYTNPPFAKIAHKIVEAYSPALQIMPISNHEAILVEGGEVQVKNN
ncbi:MAG: peptidase E [Oscillospiraceae bacterium]